MTVRRLKLAGEILGHLERLPGARRAYLRGSLAGGTVDAYSDVDLGVDVSGSDNGAFALRLADALRPHLPIDFVDWAPSLLPGAYVQSFYLRDFPIFWNVDVECVATPHVPSVTSAPLNTTDHCLKLWALTAKHCLRRREGARREVEALARRVLGDRAPDGDPRSHPALMCAVLASLAATADPARQAFLARCAQVCDQLPDR
jgi:predicted nucleotidyltransferase